MPEDADGSAYAPVVLMPMTMQQVARQLSVSLDEVRKILAYVAEPIPRQIRGPFLDSPTRALDKPLPFLISARRAAELLSLSERTLSKMSAPRGPIPCVKLGARVLYPVKQLEEWIASEAEKSLKETGNNDARE